MWVRKLPREASIDKALSVCFALFLDGLLSAVVWYILLRASVFFGFISSHSLTGAIVCAVLAVILAWLYHSHLRELGRNKATLVCDRCNILKTIDSQTECKCGGSFFPLDEMKWTSHNDARQLPSTKAESA